MACSQSPLESNPRPNDLHVRSLRAAALLRMNRLAAGKHRDELLDLARARLRSLGGGDSVQDCVAVLAVEAFEHRLRLRLGGERLGEVGWNLHPRWAGVGGLPAAVGLRSLDFRVTGRMHPVFGNQSLGDAGVSLRPGAAAAPGSEALAVGGLVPAAGLAVEPPVA